MRTATSMELLAPAGGWEQLKYAIHFGADAVYLASDRFGMRQRASNFALDELARAVAYAHAHGVTAHVTCNIVMHDADLDELARYLFAMRDAGVDALIVGDLGAFALARRLVPELELHVSTQASVSNSEAAKVWHSLGAKRIVCARELSVADISRMRAELPEDLELEAFVHGSMCMAYSGRCLISDYLTGRSALTGNCTQSCRWNYTLEEEKRPGEHYPIEEDAHGTYLMNAQDLNMLSHLDELKEAGVDSVKIEGRNKKAFYVATVVNAYRQVLDGADPDVFQAELETVSHRPYSTGFYFGPAHQAYQTDAREQSREWAAEVLEVEECAGGYRAEVLCRNAFTKDSELEVLSPRREVRSVELAAIEHLPFAKDGAVLEGYEVERANRAMEHYALTTPVELAPHDILRMRKLPAARA